MRLRFRFLRPEIVHFSLVIAAAVALGGMARGQEATPPAETTAPDGQQAVQMNPQEALEKGQNALKEGRFEEALMIFDQLAQAGERSIAPEAFQVRVVGYTGRAQALVGMKEYEAALEDFKQALDLQENFVPALTARGQMYLDLESSENYPAALADFQKAVKAQRSNLAAQFGLGKSYVLLQGWQQAIGPLTRVLDADPNNAEAYRLRGQANIGVFKVKEGEADLHKSIELNPDDYETYFALGVLYLRLENYQGAMEEMTKAIERYKPKPGQEDQPYAQGRLLLSSLYVELGKSIEDDPARRLAAYQSAYDIANKLLQEYDEKNPLYQQTRAAALYARGVAQRMLGKYGDAVQSLSQAIELNPDMGEAYFRRGICYHLLGEDKLAITDFIEAAAINYPDPRSNFWEGMTYAKQGKYYEALRAYGNAIAASDRYTPAIFNRGLAYLALGDYQKAVDDFNACIRIEPSNAEYYFKRGLAYEQLGDRQNASESFNSAIAFNDKHAGAYRHMADAMQRLGRTDEVEQYRKKAAELAPKAPTPNAR